MYCKCDRKGHFAKGCLTKGISEKHQKGKLTANLSSITTLQSGSSTQALTTCQIGPPSPRISLLIETKTALELVDVVPDTRANITEINSSKTLGRNQSDLEFG